MEPDEDAQEQASEDAFARWLQMQLRTRKLTQRALAQRSGVDHTTISRLLGGTRSPTLATLARLEEALEATYRATPQAQDDPVARMEEALLADPYLTPEDVASLVRTYQSLRRRRRQTRG